MAVKQISVADASQAMKASEDVIYVDVRTPEEFDGGHPPKAINIPVVLPNPQLQQMAPNPDFLKVVEKHVPKDKRVIVGCKMGGRSQMAAELMDRQGYVDVSNMQGGFGGAADRITGQITVPGWIQMELPVELEVTPSNSYEGLKEAAE